MPSARHRSLPMTDSRNAASVCAEITKFRFGVAITQRVFERAACRTFSTAVCMSIAGGRTLAAGVGDTVERLAFIASAGPIVAARADPVHLTAAQHADIHRH